MDKFISPSIASKRIINGKVIGIKPYGAFVKLPNGRNGLCHISEISDFFIKDISDYIEIYENYDFEILKENEQEVILSFKSIRPEHLKYFVPLQTESGFTNIKKKVEKDIISFEVQKWLK